MFKKLHINISFANALTQMPSYIEFMKEILTNKRKLEENKTIMLTEGCSALLQNKLPPNSRICTILSLDMNYFVRAKLIHKFFFFFKLKQIENVINGLSRKTTLCYKKTKRNHIAYCSTYNEVQNNDFNISKESRSWQS